MNKPNIFKLAFNDYKQKFGPLLGMSFNFTIITMVAFLINAYVPLAIIFIVPLFIAPLFFSLVVNSRRVFSDPSMRLKDFYTYFFAGMSYHVRSALSPFITILKALALYIVAMFITLIMVILIGSVFSTTINELIIDISNLANNGGASYSAMIAYINDNQDVLLPLGNIAMIIASYVAVSYFLYRMGRASLNIYLVTFIPMAIAGITSVEKQAMNKIKKDYRKLYFNNQFLIIIIHFIGYGLGAYSGFMLSDNFSLIFMMSNIIALLAILILIPHYLNVQARIFQTLMPSYIESFKIDIQTIIKSLDDIQQINAQQKQQIKKMLEDIANKSLTKKDDAKQEDNKKPPEGG
jgi:hypothetical protein